MNQVGRNPFSLDYYDSILTDALDRGYVNMTLEEFWARGCPATGALVLRHDLDVKPHTLRRMLDVEVNRGCRSTVYVRVAGAPYNFLDYPTFDVLWRAASEGFRIGLHTNYYEFSQLNAYLDPLKVLASELAALRAYFDVRSIAPHRDHNYAFNCLPHIQSNWQAIHEMNVAFQAYDDKIIGAADYVNEGYEIHLQWRGSTPEQVISTGRSVCIMTHSHWWYKKNPFEEWG